MSWSNVCTIVYNGLSTSSMDTKAVQERAKYTVHLATTDAGREEGETLKV
jgi:hypothetical protein